MKPMILKIALATVLYYLLALAPGVLAEEQKREWLTSYEEAVAVAAEGNRYILIDMWADWCGWCVALEEQVLSTAEFEDFAKDFVLLRTDTVDDNEGARLQKDYLVAKLPTTVIVTATGARVGSVTGMFPKEEYIEKLRREIAKYERMIAFYDKVRASDRTDIQRELAKELHERRDGKRAGSLFETLLAEADPKSEDAARLAYYAADAFRLGRNFDKARFHVDKARKLADRLSHSGLQEDTDLLDYYIARNDGDCVGARASLETFLERHPESSHRYDVRRFLRELKRGDFTDCHS